MDTEFAQDVEKLVAKLRWEAHFDRSDGQENRAALIEDVARKLEATMQKHGYYCTNVRAPRGLGFIPSGYRGLSFSWDMSRV